jgi:hypothetical protein
MPAFYLIGTALMAIIFIIFLPKTTKEENTSSRVAEIGKQDVICTVKKVHHFKMK